MSATATTQTKTAPGVFVPGLPHLMSSASNPGYAELSGALTKVGDRLKADKVERLLYFSTQWISVLGHSFQAKTELSGTHVDENWYDLDGAKTLPFSFKVDQAAAKNMAKAVEANGYQARLIDYDGFPVDTGTIVADRFLNRGRFSTSMLSCCVYSDYADTVKLAGILRAALDQDGKKTAFVAVSMLSGRFFTTEIDPREDHVSSPNDDQWNKRIIAGLEKGRVAEVEAMIPEYASACKVDMGLKALAFLKGVGAAVEGRAATCHAYGGLYGTGAAVIEW